MHNLIVDFCKNSTPEKGLCLSGQYYELIRKVKDFNYKNIYNDDRITSYKQYSGLIIQTIYSFLRKYYRKDIADLNTILRRDSRKYPTLTKYFEEWLIKYSGYDEKRRKKMKCGNSIVYNIQDEQEFCRAIIDYIAGMTDNFTIKSYHEIISF
ncbi:MAG: hypothetical protein LIP06_02025 [Tannerellaceae bacterium]|nr:hypothetical protein [Tannerellaceae bacterium]